MSSNRFGSVELPDAFLSGPVTRRVIIRLCWPAWWPRKRRGIRAQLRPILEDRPLHLREQTGSGEAGCVYHRLPTDTGRISISIPDIPRLSGSRFLLDILSDATSSPLGTVQLRLLDDSQARALMLANLKLEGIRIWSQNGLRCDLGDCVATTTQALVAELSIARCPLSAFGLPATEELTMELVTGNDSIELEHTTIGLSPTRVVWRSRPISVHGSPFLRAPANYTLRFRLGGREVGYAKFRVLNEADLVAHLRVAGIQTEAETRSGERVPGLRTLRWEEHQAFYPTIQIENGVVAPNTMVRCIARILRGTAVVRREEFLIRLDAGLKRFKLQRMELGSLGLRAEPKPTRLVLSVCIGGEVKGSAQVLVLPPERITNFEGQLTFDAAEIPFDQTEYEQIAQRLGLEDEGARKQSFWSWLKRWGLHSRSHSRPKSGLNTRQQTSDTVDL